jgi:hypothetical protein
MGLSGMLTNKNNTRSRAYHKELKIEVFRAESKTCEEKKHAGLPSFSYIIQKYPDKVG